MMKSGRYSLLQKVTRWTSMDPCWSRICPLTFCSNAIRSLQHSPHEFLIYHGSWPLHGFGLRKMELPMRSPLLDKERIHHFSSPLKGIQECQRSVEDVLKAMNLLISRVSIDNNITRLWQLDTATGQALRPCSNIFVPS